MDLDSAIDPDPVIVFHAPLTPPDDAGVAHDAGNAEDRGLHGPQGPLDPDPFHVMLQAPEELLDESARSRLAAEINDAGATSVDVELAEPADVGFEFIDGLRQLGSESGATRIDVHARGE